MTFASRACYSLSPRGRGLPAGPAATPAAGPRLPRAAPNCKIRPLRKELGQGAAGSWLLGAAGGCASSSQQRPAASCSLFCALPTSRRLVGLFSSAGRLQGASREAPRPQWPRSRSKTPSRRQQQHTSSPGECLASPRARRQHMGLRARRPDAARTARPAPCSPSNSRKISSAAVRADLVVSCAAAAGAPALGRARARRRPRVQQRRRLTSPGRSPNRPCRPSCAA